MTVDQILNLTYSDTNTSTNQIDSSLVIGWMNISYHDLVETIKNEVDPNFFYDYFTTDLVSGQNEYVMQQPTDIQVGMDKVSQIGIKYATTDNQFTLLHSEDASNFQKTPEWYETNQPKSSPLYMLRDDSIFIYPTPTTDVAGGLRVHGIYTPIDLVSGGAESTIKFDRQFHEGIAIGARRNIYARRSMPEMETDAINKFNEFKSRMVKSLRRRNSEPRKVQIPNLTHTFD